MKKESEMNTSLGEIEKAVFSALETYSNIHRGSGHNSAVTSRLYEEARTIVLTHLGLSSKKYDIIFCTPRRAALLTKGIDPQKFRISSSEDLGLPLGVRAVALKKRHVSENQRYFNGGGTARLVAPDWIIWAAGPGRYEAGTPAVMNILAFVKALQLKGDIYGINSGEITSSDTVFPVDFNEVPEKSGQDLIKELKKTVIGRDLEVAAASGKRRYINLDNAASTRTFLPVWESFRTALRMKREQMGLIADNTRRIISGFTKAPLSEYDIIFTSNTTESVSLVAEGLSKLHPGGTIVANTILEHNSNELPWRSFKGLTLLRLEADKNGFIDIHRLELLLEQHNGTGSRKSRKISLVTITGASNVLGTFNDLMEISRVVHKYEALLMIDAAQLIAHRSIDVNKIAADYLVFSGHKVYAPFGTGVLIARKGTLGFSQDELSVINSSGEENAAGISALGKSISLLQKAGMDLVQKDEAEITEYAVKGMLRIKDLTLYGLNDISSPLFNSRGGVISFSLKDKLAGKVGKSLAKSGIGIRTGCHCAHILVKYLIDIPPFLEKFQGFILKLFPKLELPGIARISLGIENDKEDIDVFLRELQFIAEGQISSP